MKKPMCVYGPKSRKNTEVFCLNEKAQTSFEAIVMASVIIVFSFTALGHIPKLARDTAAIAVIKSESLAVANEDWNGLYVINYISEPRNIVQGGMPTTELSVFTVGDPIDDKASKIASVAFVIEDLNIYKNVVINIK